MKSNHLEDDVIFRMLELTTSPQPSKSHFTLRYLHCSSRCSSSEFFDTKHSSQSVHFNTACSFLKCSYQNTINSFFAILIYSPRHLQDSLDTFHSNHIHNSRPRLRSVLEQHHDQLDSIR